MNHPVTVSQRVYQLLIQLYPKRFRSEYGELIMQLFRDMERDAQEEGESGLGFWLQILFDYMKSLITEHYNNITNSQYDHMKGLKNISKLYMINSILLALFIPHVLFFWVLPYGNLLYPPATIMILVLIFILICCVFLSIFYNKKKQVSIWDYASLTASTGILAFFIFFVGSFFVMQWIYPVVAAILLITSFALIWQYSKITSIFISLILLLTVVFTYRTEFTQNYCYEKVTEAMGGKGMSMDLYGICKNQFDLIPALQEKYLLIENTDMVIPTPTPPQPIPRTPAGSDRDVPGNTEQ